MKRHPSFLLLIAALMLAAANEAVGQDPGNEDSQRPRSPNNPTRATQGPNTPLPPPPGDGGPAIFPRDFRSIDGVGNSGANPLWGSAGIPLIRVTRVDYSDGSSAPSGTNRASAREISNLCAAEDEPVFAPGNVSDLFWQWGQFLDHDIDLTPIADPAEPFDIEVPLGDPYFDPTANGEQTIALDRSAWVEIDGIRQQLNEITAFIDASNIYGSDEERATALRALDGKGRLATSAGNLLPFNEEGLPNAPNADPGYFLAGDFRANEQAGLTAMHVLFMREHNLVATWLARRDPTLTGDELYWQARALVGAEIQSITYREFLPILLGPGALSPYQGYRANVDPRISNVFATAAYRFGHTMLSGTLWRLDAQGGEIPAGHLSLTQAFFNPAEITENGIASLLRGMAGHRARAIDTEVVDEVRNFLFGPPGAGGFDLASLNIQRGRDHGLPSYNQVRMAFGLEPVRRFSEIHPDPAVRNRLRDAYGRVSEIDAWVGGLAEPPVPGGLVGETFQAVLADQFERLRDGDRFWYQSYLEPNWVALLEQQTLARIIRRNTSIGGELAPDPFRVP